MFTKSVKAVHVSIALTGALFVIACAIFAITVADARSRLKSAKVSTAYQSKRRQPVQVVEFTLYDAGIYPREAYVRRGFVAISVEDISGVASSLMIERGGGQSPVKVERNESHLRGRIEIELQPDLLPKSSSDS